MDKRSKKEAIFEWLKVLGVLTVVFSVILLLVFIPEYIKSAAYQKVEIVCDTGPTYVCYVMKADIELFRNGELETFKCSIKQNSRGVITYTNTYNIDVGTIISILPIE